MNEIDRGLFLVCYDYGTGGLWGLMKATSPKDIELKYPELDIVVTRPAWMTEADLRTFEDDIYDVDGPVRGLLSAVVADRGQT
jgi:hypothetical protein